MQTTPTPTPMSNWIQFMNELHCEISFDLYCIHTSIIPYILSALMSLSYSKRSAKESSTFSADKETLIKTLIKKP